MPPTHLLDTSAYCQPIRRKPLASVERRWRSLGDRALCISVVCEMEVLQGLEMKGSARLWEAYTEALLNRLPMLPVDRPVAESYARIAADLKRRGEPRPIMDMLIAATALTHKLIVATCDAGHFTGIPGLQVEDWSI